jgi:hypothetical protein
MGSSDVAIPTPAPLTSTIAADVDLSNYDDEQVKLMEEMCIVIDENDKRIGADSKKTCKLAVMDLSSRTKNKRMFSRDVWFIVWSRMGVSFFHYSMDIKPKSGSSKRR